MKCYINGHFLSQPITGVQRYALNVLNYIDELLVEQSPSTSSIEEWIVLAPSEILYNPSWKKLRLQNVGKLKGALWQQLELPLAVKGGLLFSPCYVGPIIIPNQIVTIHDMATFSRPAGFSLAFRAYYWFMINLLSRTAKSIITVSWFSKDDLIKHCNIDHAKVHPIHLGLEHIQQLTPNTEILNKHALYGKRYILCVGSMNPNKNFTGLLEAMRHLKDFDGQIVIAGRVDKKIFGEFNLSDDPRVQHLQDISDAELKALYANALLFVFPSFYEGFGFPPLEAMSCGCPVISSREGSLPEVCGDAALYCDAYDPRDIAQKIEALLSSPERRAELSELGKQHVEQFSWRKCADQTKALIEQALKK